MPVNIDSTGISSEPSNNMVDALVDISTELKKDLYELKGSLSEVFTKSFSPKSTSIDGKENIPYTENVSLRYSESA